MKKTRLTSTTKSTSPAVNQTTTGNSSTINFSTVQNISGISSLSQPYTMSFGGAFGGQISVAGQQGVPTGVYFFL